MLTVGHEGGFFCAYWGRTPRFAKERMKPRVTWMYEARLYENRAVAHYVAMCVRDDRALLGYQESNIQILRTKKGKYAVRYQV